MKKYKIITLLILPVICTAFQFQSPLKKKKGVIAHRGAWKSSKLPQNSIAALQEAINLKCYGSEFDVHLTADDVLIVNHDHEFLGLSVEASSYLQLKSRKLENGEYIPTAEDFIKAGMRQKRTRLIMEIKPSKLGRNRTITLAVVAVNLVNRLNADRLVEYISFDYDALKKILELNPKAKVAYLGSDVAPKKLKEDGFTGLDYHHAALKKKTEWIAQAKQEGLKINVWTVNSRPDIIYFFNEKADFITTDEPELAHSILKE